MKKISLILAAIMICSGFCGCESDDSDVTTKTCNKSCSVQGGRAQACFLISGEEVCKEVCLGTKEGDNAPACWKDASQGPSALDYSITDKCAKDELGKLYSVTYESENCPKGCESGNCKKSADTTCTKDCESEGGRMQTCVRLNGQEECKDVCKGSQSATAIEGENTPFCYANALLGPTAPVFAMTDTCAKDELGTLYVVSSQSQKCSKGCEDGVCDNSGDVTCTKQCEPAPTGSPQNICVRVSGEETCKPACMGDKEGENKSCITPPPGSDVFAVTDDCAKDDLGVLYSKISVTGAKCDNGCENGECKPKSGGTECSANCDMAGGSPKVCVRINGVDSCKDTCKGAEGATLVVGENGPFCFRYASLGPTAPYLSMTNTCAEDDLGTLYATDTQSESCDIYENGTCLNGACMSMADACRSLMCEALIGGRGKTCVRIFGKVQCKDKCIGTEVGENEAKCVNNPSTGGVMSVVDTCAKDDLDTLYSQSSETHTCTATCKDGVCDDTI